MPLDPSIIQSGQGATDFTGAITSAMNMRSLAQQRQIQGIELQQKQRAFGDETALRNAMANNTSVDPNGNASVNNAGVMSDLAKTAPHLVPQVQQQIAERTMNTQKMQFEQAQQKLGMGGQFIAPLLNRDPNDPSAQRAYDAAKAQVKSLGLPIDDMPDKWGPQALVAVKNHASQALSTSQQMDQIAKERGFQLENEKNQIELRKLGIQLKDFGSKNNQETLQGLQALRGNPALQRAETNVLAAKNINDLADQTIDPKTGQRNLNAMNPQAIDLFNHELVRAATGGTGNESDLEHLSPGTPQFKLAQLHQKITGAKTPAEASAYIQQGLDYVNTLSKSSQQFLYQNAKHVVEAKRNYLAPQDQKQYDEWLGKMKTGEAFFGDMPGGDGGQTQGKTPISSATQHPQANAALQWAKQNPSDPRAAKIMQRLGQTVGSK